MYDIYYLCLFPHRLKSIFEPFKTGDMSGTNLINNCDNCTQGWHNFKNLSQSEMQMVNENRYEATFKPGEIMLKQGSPTSSCLFMSSGMAKAYIEGVREKNFILGILLPGVLIMGPGAYVDSRHSYSVAAITTVHACFISFEVFRHLVTENSKFAEGLIEDISLKALMSHKRLVSVAQKRMSGRLADALLYLSDEVFFNNEFDMILSRQELGEMTSMAKECVTRILKEFEESGVLNSDTSRIKILDKEKLIHISETG
jgi:CRP-like cAMP-binding protein